MRFLLALLVAVSVFAACDSSGDDPEFEITFRDNDGEFVATLRFPEPTVLDCDALDCNEADWRLTEGDARNAITFDRTRGTLRATQRDDGWYLDFSPPEVSDSGALAEISVDGDRVTGTWSQITIGGPMPRGTVTGTFR